MARSIDLKVSSSDLPSHGTIFLNKDALVYRVPPAVADSLRAGLIETLVFKNLPITGDQYFAKATFRLESMVEIEFFDVLDKFDKPDLVKNAVWEISSSYDNFFHKLSEARNEIGLAFNKMRDLIKV